MSPDFRDLLAVLFAQSVPKRSNQNREDNDWMSFSGVRQGVEMIRGKRAPSRSFRGTDLRIVEEEYAGPRGTEEWDKHTRPPANVCPKRYCFMWAQRSEPIGNLPAIPEGRCECGLGLCSRLDPGNGEGDFYEPCEPELDDADLPWWYFMDPAPLLASPFRKKYLRLVRELWGDDHHQRLEEAMPGDAGTKGTGSAGKTSEATKAPGSTGEATADGVDAGTKGTGSAGRTPGSDAGTKGTGSAG